MAESGYYTPESKKTLLEMALAGIKPGSPEFHTELGIGARHYGVKPMEDRNVFERLFDNIAAKFNLQDPKDLKAAKDQELAATLYAPIYKHVQGTEKPFSLSGMITPPTPGSAEIPGTPFQPGDIGDRIQPPDFGAMNPLQAIEPPPPLTFGRDTSIKSLVPVPDVRTQGMTNLPGMTQPSYEESYGVPNLRSQYMPQAPPPAPEVMTSLHRMGLQTTPPIPPLMPDGYRPSGAAVDPVAAVDARPHRLGQMALSPELAAELSKHSVSPADLQHIMTSLKTIEPVPKDADKPIPLSEGQILVHPKTFKEIARGLPKEDAPPPLIKLQRELAKLPPGSKEAHEIQGNIDLLSEQSDQKSFLSVATSLFPDEKNFRDMDNKPVTEADAARASRMNAQGDGVPWVAKVGMSQKEATANSVKLQAAFVAGASAKAANEALLSQPATGEERRHYYDIDLLKQRVMKSAPPISQGDLRRSTRHVFLSSNDETEMQGLNHANNTLDQLFARGEILLADSGDFKTRNLNMGKIHAMAAGLPFSGYAEPIKDADGTMTTKGALAKAFLDQSKSFSGVVARGVLAEKGVLTDADRDVATSAAIQPNDSKASAALKKSFFKRLNDWQWNAIGRLSSDNVTQADIDAEIKTKNALMKEGRALAGDTSPASAPSGQKDFRRMTDQELRDIAAGKK